MAGGIPIVRAVREGLAGDRLLRVAGILNGTCNYILTRMDSAGLSFADALKEAQALGYAEADPSADVDGYDARAKIAILIAVGLGCQVDPEHIPCRSISSIDRVDFTYAQKARLHDPPDFMGGAGAGAGPAAVCVGASRARAACRRRSRARRAARTS